MKDELAGGTAGPARYRWSILIFRRSPSHCSKQTKGIGILYSRLHWSGMKAYVSLGSWLNLTCTLGVTNRKSVESPTHDRKNRIISRNLLKGKKFSFYSDETRLDCEHLFTSSLDTFSGKQSNHVAKKDAEQFRFGAAKLIPLVNYHFLTFGGISKGHFHT